MEFITRVIALISVVYLIKVFLYPFYRPAGRKQKGRTRKYEKDKTAEQRKRRNRERKLKIAKTFAIRLPLMRSKEDLRKTLNRLNSEKLPEEIWLEQNLWLLAGALVSMFLFAANTVLGLIALLLLPLGYLMPTDELDKEIRRKNRNIAMDFPQFYSMLHYQYSKSIHVFLSDVILDFMPNANDDMAEELNIMLQNIEYADEEYALKQFKKRVPIRHIIKFCDLLETRLRGYDNVSQMQYLKNEIERFRVTQLENELEKRVRTNNFIQLVLLAILGLYIVLYFVFTILGSLAMFA